MAIYKMGLDYYLAKYTNDEYSRYSKTTAPFCNAVANAV